MEKVERLNTEQTEQLEQVQILAVKLLQAKKRYAWYKEKAQDYKSMELAERKDIERIEFELKQILGISS